MSRLSHVATALTSQPWFWKPEGKDGLRAAAELVAQHISGDRLASTEIAERVAAAAARNGPRGGAKTAGQIGVIPIYGPIFPRANLFTDFSGGSTVEGIRGAFREAMADPQIAAILLDVDSPGGSVDGIEELAAEIRGARGKKPILSIANYCMASAALYIGAQADEVSASPSATVGWVGTFLAHQEFSKAEEMEGVTTTIIRNPEGKGGGNPHEPLLEQTRNEFVAMVDEYTTMFEQAVARGRGVPVAQVRSDFGQGGGMTASRARAVGLVDHVETFDEAIGRLAAGKVQPRSSRQPQTSAPYRIEVDAETFGAIADRQATEALVTQRLEEEIAAAQSADDDRGELDEVALERARGNRRQRTRT